MFYDRPWNAKMHPSMGLLINLTALILEHCKPLSSILVLAITLSKWLLLF